MVYLRTLKATVDAWEAPFGAVTHLPQNTPTHTPFHSLCCMQAAGPLGGRALSQRFFWGGSSTLSLSPSSPAADAQHEKTNGNAAAENVDAMPEESEKASSSGSTTDEPLPTPDELKTALAAAQEETDFYRAQTEDLKEKLVRTLADMENLRERTSRQTAEARQFGVQSLVKSLVEVADNLERAVGSISATEIDGSSELDLNRAVSLLRSLRDGVVMTDGILMKILGKEGVTRYDPIGHPFDPNMHNALFEVADATKEPKTVAVVIKKGYMLHDRAIRAAEVGVVKAVDDEEREG